MEAPPMAKEPTTTTQAPPAKEKQTRAPPVKAKQTRAPPAKEKQTRAPHNLNNNTDRVQHNFNIIHGPFILFDDGEIDD